MHHTFMVSSELHCSAIYLYITIVVVVVAAASFLNAKRRSPMIIMCKPASEISYWKCVTLAWTLRRRCRNCWKLNYGNRMRCERERASKSLGVLYHSNGMWKLLETKCRTNEDQTIIINVYMLFSDATRRAEKCVCVHSSTVATVISSDLLYSLFLICMLYWEYAQQILSIGRLCVSLYLCVCAAECFQMHTNTHTERRRGREEHRE